LKNLKNKRRRSPGSDPLSGLAVIELSDDHAGAIVGMFLADFGADVIKFTPPGGFHLQRSSSYSVWDRDKTYTPVDALSGDGSGDSAELVEAILSADIVISSLTSEILASIGVDSDTLMASNRRLIWLAISARGRVDEPGSDFAGEGLIAAETGVLTEQRTRDGSPFWNALPLVGFGTAMLGALGVLSALHRREVTGLGQRVDTSLVQGSLAARSPMLVRGEGVETWNSAGNDPQGALPNYRLYETSDGQWIHIGALTPDFWNKLSIAGDLLELVTDPQFDTAPMYWATEEVRSAAKKAIGDRIATRTRDEWVQILQDGDVPVAPAQTTDALINHPQVIANGIQADVESESGGPGAQVAPSITLHGSKSDRSEGFIPEPDPEFNGPLSGVHVLDLSAYLAGPIGPAYLADLGANVIKVEPLTGEGCRVLMMLYLGGNTGKRDLALNMKSAEAREPLERLIKWADIIVHNNRVGVAERLGIDHATVREINPEVIYLHTTGFGSEGPMAMRPGFDPLAQSFTGISQAQGGPGRAPVFPKTPICDIATAMLGAAGSLVALYHRDRTGEGQRIDNSLLSTGLWLKSDSFVRQEGFVEPILTNADNTGLHAAHRSYEASDGWIFVGVRTDDQKAALAVVMGVSALEGAGLGVDGDDQTAQQAQEVFGSATVAEWLERFTEAGVPAARVAEDIEEGVYGNVDVLRLQAVTRAEYPGFTNLRQPGLLIGFSESSGERRRGSPACGQDTESVLAELDYSAEQIAALESAGAVARFDEQDQA
jgi:crotonobetainyl-CoA:carnitine CoA-transferase CaiB-like acyl-CoA transferase